MPPNGYKSLNLCRFLSGELLKVPVSSMPGVVLSIFLCGYNYIYLVLHTCVASGIDVLS